MKGHLPARLICFMLCSAVALSLAPRAAHANRYYSTDLGRFVSKDPIGFEGGLNLYEYVGGRPTLVTDPVGLFDWLSRPKVSCSPRFVRRCGVRRLDYKGRWETRGLYDTPGGKKYDLGFPIDVTLELRNDGNYDPACCFFVQFVWSEPQKIGKYTLTRSQGGMPLDGEVFHVDAIQYLGHDDVAKYDQRGALRRGTFYGPLNAPSGGQQTVHRTGHDPAALLQVPANAAVYWHSSFWGRVFDRCNDYFEVFADEGTNGIGIKISGSWYKGFKGFPPPLPRGGKNR